MKRNDREIALKRQMNKWRPIPTDKGFMVFQSLETKKLQWEFPTIKLPGVHHKVSILYFCLL